MLSAIGQAFDIAWLVLRVLVLVGLPVALVIRTTIAAVHFARLPCAGKRLWLPARWHRLRWRWLCANLGLSYTDKRRRGVSRPGSTSATVGTQKPGRLRFPRARFTPDAFGFTPRLRPSPASAVPGWRRRPSTSPTRGSASASLPRPVPQAAKFPSAARGL